ncbi:MAG: Fic family protein [Rhodococcus sp. (in: high G+C Gram-positive bacteria)]
MSNAGQPGRWPAVSYESLPWDRDSNTQASRVTRRRSRGPYRSSIPIEIQARQVQLPAATTAEAEDAATEVARFDAELGHEIAPFATVLLRSESAASSKIENLTASARAIAEAELRAHAGRNATLIVANQRAMTAAIALAEHIDADAILAMHAALLTETRPEIAGRWRDEPVWIGGSDHSPHDALFVPPRRDFVTAAISDLLAFIDRDDVPLLAHAAIAHAQFETIHPFPDGNGRTGRALIHAQLRHKGLTRNVTLPVSAGLLTDTAAYFAALTAYRQGDLVAIVEQFSRAAFAAVTNGRQLVDDLRAIRAGWDDRIVARRDSGTWKIADLLLRHPVVNAALLANELGIAPQNTYRSLARLVEVGIIIEFTDQKRNQLWRSTEVLDALDRFAARAGRRTRGTAIH